MGSFSFQLLHRGGAVDDHPLGVLPDAVTATRMARTYLFVSPSAIAADIFVDGCLAAHIARADGGIDHMAAREAA